MTLLAQLQCQAWRGNERLGAEHKSQVHSRGWLDHRLDLGLLQLEWRPATHWSSFHAKTILDLSLRTRTRGRGSQSHKDRHLRGSVPQPLLVVSVFFSIPLKAPAVGSSEPTVPGRGMAVVSNTTVAKPRQQGGPLRPSSPSPQFPCLSGPGHMSPPHHASRADRPWLWEGRYCLSD